MASGFGVAAAGALGGITRGLMAGMEFAQTRALIEQRRELMKRQQGVDLLKGILSIGDAEQNMRGPMLDVFLRSQGADLEDESVKSLRAIFTKANDEQLKALTSHAVRLGLQDPANIVDQAGALFKDPKSQLGFLADAFKAQRESVGRQEAGTSLLDVGNIQQEGAAGRVSPVDQASFMEQQLTRLAGAPQTEPVKAAAARLGERLKMLRAKPAMTEFFTDETGNRLAVGLDEQGREVFRRSLGKVAQPSNLHLQTFTNERGTRVVVGLDRQSGRVLFRRSLGQTAEQARFNLGQYRKNLALRKRGRNVQDQEVQSLTPQEAGAVLEDLGRSGFLEALLGLSGGGASPEQPAAPSGSLTPEQEADAFLSGR